MASIEDLLGMIMTDAHFGPEGASRDRMTVSELIEADEEQNASLREMKWRINMRRAEIARQRLDLEWDPHAGSLIIRAPDRHGEAKEGFIYDEPILSPEEIAWLAEGRQKEVEDAEPE